MIFDIHEHKNSLGQVTDIYFVEITPNYQAWDLIELMRECFPRERCFVACYNGYENAVEFQLN